MKTTEIAHKIENPNSFALSDIGELELLIQKYPYAQTFPILLLKTLGQSKDLHFEEALNKHAFRISDRMHLYYLINDISDDLAVKSSELQDANSEVGLEVESSVEVIKEVTSSELQVASSEVEELEVVSSKFQVQNSEDSIDGEVIRLDYEELLDEDIKFAKVEEMTFEPVRIHITESGEVEGVVDEIKPEVTEPSVPEVETQPEIEAEISIEEQVVPSEVEEILEDLNISQEEVPEDEIPEPIEEENETSNSLIEDVPLKNIEKELVEVSIDEIEEEVTLEEVEEDEFEEEIEEIPSSVGMEFFDPTVDLELTKSMEDLTILEPSSFEEERKIISLDLVNKQFDPAADEFTSNAIAQGFHITLDNIVEKGNESNVSESIKKFEQNNSDEKRSFNSWLHANEKSIETEKPHRSAEIIEKFIQEDPKISRSVKPLQTELSEEKKKVPFFKATEKAKESLQENVIPVSSTLAQIFEAQGNFPKAIHSYEQLMLLYPEKKTFFANQIKKLKEKLNN